MFGVLNDLHVLNLDNNPTKWITLLFIFTEKLRRRKVKEPVQSHIANKMASKDNVLLNIVL